MRHVLSILATVVLATAAAAKTPDAVVVGSAANTWTQAGLRVTQTLFDLAVQGSGFFALRGADGEIFYTREGLFAVDTAGFITHKTLGGALLGMNCASDQHGLHPISVANAARHGDGGTLKSLRTGLDGLLEGIYSDGYVARLDCIGLAIFQNPRKLRREDGHRLRSTEASGAGFVDLAQKETRGSIYEASLEDLTEDIYAASLD